MPIETWLVFLLVAVLPAISPGPAVLLAVSNSLRFGADATLWSALGNAVGLIVLGMGVSLGLGALMKASALAFTILKIVGAVYLVWLGVKVWRDRSLLETPDGTAPRLRTRRALFGQAVLVSLTNPKAILILTALFPPFLDASRPLVAQAAILPATYAALCYANHLLLAVIAGRLRLFMVSARGMSCVRRVTGGAFIAFGMALAAASRT